MPARKKLAEPDQGHHYFASTFAAWATGPTRQDAIRGALTRSGATLVKQGIEVLSCRVELPQRSHYMIERHLPKGVPITEVEKHEATSMKGKLRRVYER